MRMTRPFNYTGDRVFEIPQYFWEDHLDRCPCAEDCPDQETHHAGRVVKMSRTYRVTLTATDANELYSDASYYIAVGFALDPELLGLVSSARATLKRLDKKVA